MSNAKRFGGKYSDGGATPEAKTTANRFAGRKAREYSWRVVGLYAAPTLLIIPAIGGFFTADIAKILWAGCPYILLILSAWLTGEGMKAEAAYNERSIAKPPAFPRKSFAGALTGVAVFTVAFLGVGVGLIPSAIFGGIAVLAHVLSFGLDPTAAKGVDGVSDAELDRVAEKLDRAEAVVAETVAAADDLRDRRLEERIGGLAYAARDILKEIQKDPRDLRRSRKFLSVHLVGLRDATRKYAAAKAKGAADEMAGEFEGLLSDLEKSFAKQRKTLLIDDKVDLEVEIEVLRDRLKQEGAL